MNKDFSKREIVLIVIICILSVISVYNRTKVNEIAPLNKKYMSKIDSLENAIDNRAEHILHLEKLNESIENERNDLIMRKQKYETRIQNIYGDINSNDSRELRTKINTLR